MTTNKTVLITGSSRGLGRALAVAFAKNGYSIAVHYHQNKSEATTTLNLLQKIGVRAELFQADVRKSSEVNKLVQDVVTKFGCIDVLVNNAGSVRNNLISKMSDDDWGEVLASNLTGAFYCTRAVIPVMRKQSGGVIINMTSYSAGRGVRGGGNYAAAKAGLIALTKNTAMEEGGFNVRVNAVLPGFHVTDINTDVWKRFEADIRKQHLLEKMPDREEMAEFVVKIAGLSSVTGQVFAFESRLT